MAKVIISLLVLLSLFATFGHALPSMKMFNPVRLDAHLTNNATCEERKKYYVNTNIEASWLTAHLICKSYGFQEVSFNNQLEMNGLLDYIQTRYTNSSFWLGATNMNPLGNEATSTTERHGFYWFSTGININFPLRWFAGEPNLPRSEHCLQANFRNGIIGINDNVCSREMYFICELNDCPKKF